MGLTWLWLSLIVLIPLSAMVLRAAGLSATGWWALLADPDVQMAFWVTFGCAAVAALVAGAAGLVVAWALVRCRFPGWRVVDALIDLPFALPTAVTGIALAVLWSKDGLLGQALAPLGLAVTGEPLGITLAMVVVCLPFVVRGVQPVLEDLDPSLEEAAATLGAGRLSIVCRVLVPALLPALIGSMALAFARAAGEYGSVIFISNNLPGRSEVTAVKIIQRLEQNDYAGAAAIGTLMLLVSFATLLVVNLAQSRSARQLGGRA